MAPASNEEQFKFLISCIRYSNNGKVDFGQVAQECKIVSKGAAAKRYERMMRAHGIAPNAATIKPAPIRTTKTDHRESSSAVAPSKKRKAEQFVEENTDADDDEGFGNMKADPANEKEQFCVKEEEQAQQLSMADAANLAQFYDAPSYNGAQVGGDQGYAGNEYGEGSAGYATPIGGAYGMEGSYDFGVPYGAPALGSMGGMGGMRSVPRNNGQGFHYQRMMQYPAENQGRSDSPVVVE